MGRRDVADRHGQLLQEIKEERIAALTRISRTLEALIAQLHRSLEHISQLAGEERVRAVAQYREVRDRAKQYRWYLDVQREALGLRHHPTLDEMYEIPGPIDR